MDRGDARQCEKFIQVYRQRRYRSSYKGDTNWRTEGIQVLDIVDTVELTETIQVSGQ